MAETDVLLEDFAILWWSTPYLVYKCQIQHASHPQEPSLYVWQQGQSKTDNKSRSFLLQTSPLQLKTYYNNSFAINATCRGSILSSLVAQIAENISNINNKEQSYLPLWNYGPMFHIQSWCLFFAASSKLVNWLLLRDYNKVFQMLSQKQFPLIKTFIFLSFTVGV